MAPSTTTLNHTVATKFNPKMPLIYIGGALTAIAALYFFWKAVGWVFAWMGAQSGLEEPRMDIETQTMNTRPMAPFISRPATAAHHRIHRDPKPIHRFSRYTPQSIRPNCMPIISHPIFFSPRILHRSFHSRAQAFRYLSRCSPSQPHLRGISLYTRCSSAPSCPSKHSCGHRASPQRNGEGSVPDTPSQEHAFEIDPASYWLESQQRECSFVKPSSSLHHTSGIVFLLIFAIMAP
ncbi:hypothetical protein HGRIS_004711 [Hohenbuehelia grisea]|uniref:Uncharacterized protein n=1 Tax=Hohenbuehelia grisea TaxID=104357 RepID=A0ABR3JD47_9AGAR